MDDGKYKIDQFYKNGLKYGLVRINKETICGIFGISNCTGMEVKGTQLFVSHQDPSLELFEIPIGAQMPVSSLSDNRVLENMANILKSFGYKVEKDEG